MRAFNSPSIDQKDVRDLLEQIESCKSVSDVRVLKTKLLFVNGLVSEVSLPQVLQRGEYMGQYGRISKMTFSKVKENFYSAFVEYQTEPQAALALLSLDNFLFKGKVVKVFYGSTKYCFSFLKGEECRMRQCAFSHQYQRKYTYFKNNTSSIDHSKIAERILLNTPQPMITRQVSHPRFPKPFKILQRIQCQQEEMAKSLVVTNSTIQNSQTSMEAVMLEEEWKELQEQISGFAKTQEDKKEFRKKTKVQEFLDYAEEKLHSLIFKSSQMYPEN